MEFFLSPDGKAQPCFPGGPALYAAAGFRVWSKETIGLVSRVGGNFSSSILQDFQHRGFNTAGIRILPGHEPSLGFHYYETWEKHIDWDPVKYYSRYRLACPEELLDYSPPSRTESNPHSFPETAVRSEDIPADFFQARAVYITPCHYQSQITLSVTLRQRGTGVLLLSPPEGLLLPSFRPQIRELLHGIDILFAREQALKTFLGGGEADTPALSESISHWGPEIVLLQRDLQGIHAYDSSSGRSLFIPWYPVEIKNPLSMGDSFCGGFLSSWRRTYDLMESTLVGCISASMSAEGMGGLYALDRNPGLAEARLTSLRRSLKR